MRTSRFSYAEWRGPFHPAELPASDMRGWYAGRLGAVEINNIVFLKDAGTGPRLAAQFMEVAERGALRRGPLAAGAAASDAAADERGAG